MADQAIMRVRDYAVQHGCSPQNIYKHLRTYAAELEGHTFRGPGRQGVLLDAFAQEFLRGVMYPKEIGDSVLVQQINELRALLSQSDHKASELLREKMEAEALVRSLSADLQEQRQLLQAAEDKAAQKQAEAEAEREQAAADLEQLRAEAAQRLQEAQAAEEREMAALAAQKAAEDALEATEAINRDQAAELDRLRKRGLWARIRNK